MKQIIQSFKTGKTELIEVPTPSIEAGHILIKTTKSLISLGTEKMLVEFGQSSLISKAKKQPDKVKMVLDKIKSEGLIPTIKSVKNKLDQPIPLGYCNVGKVVEVGSDVKNFKIGDRVASNGPHAEFVLAPENLCANIPKNVSDEEASFTVVASIGLQSIRLLNPTYGENIVVIGLGLIGLLTAEMLMSNGCNVIGYDLDDKKVNLAKSKGVKAFNPISEGDITEFILRNTNNIGADGVIITASSKNGTIISDAANMSRKRGKIILVGVVDLNLVRSEFYEKELTFQVSCSYGPGRYDNNYELKGNDYPLPFVRWTEKRNFETVLDSISNSRLKVKDLITEIVELNNYDEVYSNISSSKSIASLLNYNPVENKKNNSVKISKKVADSNGEIAIVGSGNFTKMTLLPTISQFKPNLKYIVSKKGLNGTLLAKKYNIEYSSTSFQDVLNDKNVKSLIITTRHNLHAEMVIQGLKNNKHVFVEKPLAINFKQLKKIESEYLKSSSSLMVGYNRRFSPHVIKAKSLIASSVVNITATMNAGHIPQDSWVQDMKIGGGRIIGEACHYFDLMVFLTGSKIDSLCINSFGKNPLENTDNVSILLKFENGSNGVINYFSNGSRSYSKEKIEIFSENRTYIIDNFKLSKGYGFKNFNKLKTRIDKGHRNQFKSLISNINSGHGIELIPYDEIINVTKASLYAIESLKENSWKKVI